MITEENEDVKPLFLERVDDFAMSFNSGGKMEI